MKPCYLAILLKYTFTLTIGHAQLSWITFSFTLSNKHRNKEIINMCIECTQGKHKLHTTVINKHIHTIKEQQWNSLTTWNTFQKYNSFQNSKHKRERHLQGGSGITDIDNYRYLLPTRNNHLFLMYLLKHQVIINAEKL